MIRELIFATSAKRRKAIWALKETKLRVKYMTTKDCIFCKIVQGEIKAQPIGENASVVAINDINPVAETHILIFPKRHIDSVLTIGRGDGEALEDMMMLAQQIVEDKKIEAFRLAYNGGRYQHIPHLHMHLLAGGTIKWSKL